MNTKAPNLLKAIFNSKTVLKTAIHLCLSIALLFFISLTAAAQTSSTDGSTPAGLQRGGPAGSYQLSGFDNVNLYNGNLQFTLPLMSIGGRGSASSGIALSINSKRWHVEDYSTEFYESFVPDPNWWTAVEPGYTPGIMQGRKAGIDKRTCHQNPPSSDIDVYKYTYTTLTFVAADGTEYTFYDQTYLGEPKMSSTCPGGNGQSRGTVFITMDGSAATFISDSIIYDTVDILPGYVFYPSGYMILKDGTRYRINGGGVSWIRDRNGNKTTFANVNGVYTITDSLNRQVTVEKDQECGSFYGTCDIISFKGYGGATRQIRISKLPLNDALRSDFSLQTYSDLFPGLNGSTGSKYETTVVSAVWLPNTVDQDSPHYSFKYNSYADLARIELPTGGAIEYDYTPANQSVIGTTPYEIYRRVTERRVYKDGTNLESKTTYTVNQDERTDPYPWYSDVTVDELTPSDQLMARSKHYFKGVQLKV